MHTPDDLMPELRWLLTQHTCNTKDADVSETQKAARPHRPSLSLRRERVTTQKTQSPQVAAQSAR